MQQFLDIQLNWVFRKEENKIRNTGYLPNEDEKLDSLLPGSREMGRCRWEGQNFQLLKEVQCLEEEEKRISHLSS